MRAWFCVYSASSFRAVVTLTVRHYRWTVSLDQLVTDPTTPITAADRVVLAPGANRDDLANAWAAIADATIPRAGSYTLWAVFRECGSAASATTDASAESQPYRGIHSSNAVHVVVR